MQIEAILPWQTKIWQSLLQRKESNCLPHAFLFSGADGVGKKQLSYALANYLLCHAPQKTTACGQCRACHLQQAQSHADFMLVEPEKDAQFIKIDQIREVVAFVNHTALLAGYKIIIIRPASAMNMAAVNALLKTLEEPAANTLFILICQQSSRLPATIFSRCQQVVFPFPSQAEALAWLQENFTEQDPEKLTLLLNMVHGAPLRARDFLLNDVLTLRQNLYNGLIQLNNQQIDPLQFATQWEEKNIVLLLELLLTWLQDLLRYKLIGLTVEIINQDYKIHIQALSKKFSSETLLQYTELMQKIYARVVGAFNANRQLILKEIFIYWMKLC